MAIQYIFLENGNFVLELPFFDIIMDKDKRIGRNEGLHLIYILLIFSLPLLGNLIAQFILVVENRNPEKTTS